MTTLTKVRGFTLQDCDETMSPEVMGEFIQDLRDGKEKGKQIPQFTLKIDQQTHEITEKMVEKEYSNISNEKRWFDPDIDKNRLFAYGVTQYPA